MSKLLFIKASPRAERSHSIALATAFLERYAALNPGDEIVTWDLFSMELPKMDGEMLRVKYNIMHGRQSTEAEKAAWSGVENVIRAFKSAQKLVYAVPMWNFSIPYTLKHLIDVITQPTYTFAVTDKGYQGLAKAKAFIAYARGGDYQMGTGREDMNQQSRYLESSLAFIGVTDVQSVAVEPTLRGDELKDQAKRDALRKALAIAENF